MTKPATHHLGVRVPAEMRDRLSAVTDRDADPYAPTVTQIVVRGIELALAERQGTDVA